MTHKSVVFGIILTNVFLIFISTILQIISFFVTDSLILNVINTVILVAAGYIAIFDLASRPTRKFRNSWCIPTFLVVLSLIVNFKNERLHLLVALMLSITLTIIIYWVFKILLHFGLIQRMENFLETPQKFLDSKFPSLAKYNKFRYDALDKDKKH